MGSSLFCLLDGLHSFSIRYSTSLEANTLEQFQDLPNINLSFPHGQVTIEIEINVTDVAADDLIRNGLDEGFRPSREKFAWATSRVSPRYFVGKA
jgi:hypothetical protein